MMRIRDAVEFLGGDVDVFLSAFDIGECEILGAKPVNEAVAGQFAFVGGRPGAMDAALSTRATLLVTDVSTPVQPEDILAKGQVKAVIRSPNARLTFMRLLGRFFGGPSTGSVHASAIIHPSVKMGKNVSIGPYVVIDADCVVGDDVVIASHVVIHCPTLIGHRVRIGSGTVLGTDGFGYERNEAGAFEKFPHVGGIVIGDDVEIGANTCIDRGTLGDTVIGHGTKIDNLVHISHNVQIGRHCAVIAHAMIGGSVRVGDNAWIAPSTAVRDQLLLGEGSTVGLGSVVVKNVSDNSVVMGVPARPKA